MASDTKGTVWITQWSPTRDFSDARRFGKIKWFTKEEIYADDADSKVASIMAEVRLKLVEFDAAKDCLLLSGDPAIVALVMVELVRWTLTVPILKYDRTERQYFKFNIPNN